MGRISIVLIATALLLSTALASGLIMGSEASDLSFWHQGELRPSAVGLPEITNITSGSPTTGDQFSLKARVTDPDGVSNVTVEYWFGTGARSNSSMSSLPNDQYSYWVSIPSGSVDPLHYIFHADDSLGNWNQSAESNVSVTDNDDPVFGSDYSDTSPTTGEDLDLLVEITDNIGVDDVSVEYWFGSGGHINKSLSNQGGNLWGGSVKVSSDAVSMRYRFHGSDSADNTAETTAESLTVSDNDRPIFIGVSPIPSAGTGDTINITVGGQDNIAVDSVSLEYRFGTGPEVNRSMSRHSGDSWYILVQIPVDSLDDLNYTFHAEDKTGNYNFSGPYITRILDDEAPVLVNDSSDPDGTTGDPYNFTIEGRDNIGISNATVSYRFGIDNWTHVNLINFMEDNWTAVLVIPNGTSADMEYFVTLTDGAGNHFNSTSRFVPIQDNDPPYVVDDSTYDNASTGEWFSFSVVIDDNVMIHTSFVEYWFGDGEHVTEPMVGMCQGPHLFFFVIPLNSTEDLFYRFIFNDTSNNTVKTSVKMVVIWDNDLPSFGPDLSDTNATTGDEFALNITVHDNIDVSNVTVEYGFEEGSYINTSLSRIGTTSNWIGSISILSNSTDLIKFRFHAVDSSGNMNSTYWFTRSIADNDPPVIVSPSAPPPATTGDLYKFSVEVTDNINIDEVWMDYRFGEGITKELVLAMGSGSEWIGQMPIPHTLDKMFFTVHSTDSSGNDALNVSGEIDIMDNDMPELILENSTRKGTTGEIATFKIEAGDNIGITDVSLEYWMLSGDHLTTEMNGSGIYQAAVLLPHNMTGILHYIFHINDTSGNQLISMEYSLNVTDNDPPVIFGYDFEPEVAVIGGQIGISLNATDNLGIDSALIAYRIGTGDIVNLMLQMEDGHYVASVDVPDGSLSDLMLMFRVLDRSGNEVSTDWINITSVDLTAPSIDPIGDVYIYVGESLNLTSVVSDNHMISRVTWNGGGISHTGRELNMIPANSMDTVVIVTVTDISGNSANIEFRLVVWPDDRDGDGDGMPDLYEIDMGFDPEDGSNRDSDPDHDNVTNIEEYLNSTDPWDRDSDNDGMDDGWEILFGLDPIFPDGGLDPDGDNRTNLDEYNLGSDPNVPDIEEDEDDDNEKEDYLILIILAAIFLIFTIIGLYFYFREKPEDGREEYDDILHGDEEDSEYHAIGDDEDLDQDLEVVQEMEDIEIPDEDEEILTESEEADLPEPEEETDLQEEEEIDLPGEVDELEDLDEIEEPEL